MIRHGSRTRTRPGRRQKHSVKRDHFVFHIMLSWSRLSRDHGRSEMTSHGLVALLSISLYFAIDLPSSRTSQLFAARPLIFSHDIAVRNVGIRFSASHCSLRPRLLPLLDKGRSSSSRRASKTLIDYLVDESRSEIES